VPVHCHTTGFNRKHGALRAQQTAQAVVTETNRGRGDASLTAHGRRRVATPDDLLVVDDLGVVFVQVFNVSAANEP